MQQHSKGITLSGSFFGEEHCPVQEVVSRLDNNQYLLRRKVAKEGHMNRLLRLSRAARELVKGIGSIN